ncbi:MAG: sugar ABC transporter ATP-binding protein, partial [Clostridia bacterium]|nr:sugar ABC transporter ATP-binding protein [Clostridia bacterium]
MQTPILNMEHITKEFTGVKALKDANFDLYPGEVHALVGENGAGKSTLMKILTGIHQRDGGTVTFSGKELHLKNPKEAQDMGIIIVHQELNMMNHLTVAENIFIGREEKKLGFWLDDKKIEKRSEELFQKLGISINPKETIGNLTVGKQQMVEIAKAISYHAKIIVFDEPTAALTETEINELFRMIADLKKKGVGMIYISHRMDEIERITDRVTVMRDGEYIGTVNTKDTTKDEIINMMVGRVIYEDPKSESTVKEDAEIVLKAEGITAPSVKNASFSLRKGEILGFAGLMGAGRTELARAIFGADKMQEGSLFIHGKRVVIRSPMDAVKNGIGYLSEDRKRFGLAVDLSVSENSVLASLKRFSRLGFVNTISANRTAKEYCEKLKTKTPSVHQLVRNLSGGNQQKVVIAKWLIEDSQILIFDEPTRGIDVGAKSEIYTLMNELAQMGKSIIMISSELTEVLRMSDRIIVMCEGRITGELDIKDANQEAIMKLATLRE